jgi:ABC-type spermidine/putrescine transport system permease subunit I
MTAAGEALEASLMEPERRRFRAIPAPLLPATIVMIVLLVAPLAVLLSYSVLEVNGAAVEGGISFATFGRLLSSRYFWFLFGRTFAIALGVTLLCLVIGYPIAFLITRVRGWLRAVILVAVAAPLLTSGIIRAFAWIVILGKQGLVNFALTSTGLADEPVSLLFQVRSVVIGMTQLLLPFMVIPLISAIQDVPAETTHAARNLGASEFRIFWRVLVPQTVPGAAAGITLVFALGYSEFTLAMLLGGGSFNYLSIYIYDSMTSLLDWGRGAAAAALLLASSLLTVVILNLVVRRLTRWSRQTN